MTIRKMSFLEPCPMELYLPRRPGRYPLICLTPILGRLGFLEDLFMERHYARFFAKHGFAACLIDRPIFEFDPHQNLHQIQNYLESSAKRSVVALDCMVKQEEVDPQAVGSFGISFGAIVNILWAARDPRLTANVFALAGGNIPEIIMTSRDPLMRSYARSIVKGTGLAGAELQSALKNSIQIDPLQAAGFISPGNVLLLLGIFDRVIRFRYGLGLRKALRNPETIFIPLGHYFTLLAAPFLIRRALTFFRKKWGKTS